MSDNELVFAIVSATLLVLLLVAALVIVFFIAGRQRLRQQMELAQARVSFEQELRQVETEVSEHILHKLAQELHDNIGQLLTAMRFQVETQKIDHPQLAEGLKPIEIYLAEVTQQLRFLSHTLNHDYLGHIGLLGAMQVEIDRLRNLRRFQLEWNNPSGKTNLDKNQELMVFRIFQEIIQNILRHSTAGRVSINVRNDKGRFKLTVSDDGQGFEPGYLMQSNKASGLRNILKRAALAGLQCQIDAAVGKGCRITLEKRESLNQ